MSNRIASKVRSARGASFSMALMLFLVCTVMSSIVIGAATAAAGQIAKRGEYEQRYSKVTSAVRMLDSYFGDDGVAEFQAVQAWNRVEDDEGRTNWTPEATLLVQPGGTVSTDMFGELTRSLVFNGAAIDSNAQAALSTMGIHFDSNNHPTSWLPISAGPITSTYVITPEWESKDPNPVVEADATITVKRAGDGSILGITMTIVFHDTDAGDEHYQATVTLEADTYDSDYHGEWRHEHVTQIVWRLLSVEEG